EETKAGALQQKAQKYVEELEKEARDRVGQARQLNDKGQSAEAIAMLTETIRDYPGLTASREAADLMTRFAQASGLRNTQRVRKAQELLAQARESYKSKDYILCLDRCDTLTGNYGDLDEGQQAAQMAAEIKNNPDILQNACDNLSARPATIYLALTDSFLQNAP